jgi:hypothetical protein
MLSRRRMIGAMAVGGLLGTVRPAAAQLDKWLKGVPGLGSGGLGAGLSDARIGQGLQEALRVATERAVSLTGRHDRFFGNALIKILMPEKMRTVEKGLRAVGYGPQCDEFVLSMYFPGSRSRSGPGAEGAGGPHLRGHDDRRHL